MIHIVYDAFKTTPEIILEELQTRGIDARIIKLAPGKKLKTFHGDLAVNWGTRVFETTCSVKTLNNFPKYGKIKMFEILNGCGLRTPPWGLRNNPPRDIDYPVLIRKSAGFGGTDIIYCENSTEFNAHNEGDFWVKYIPKTYEFRVHVFRGKMISLTRKVSETNDYDHISWNFGCGFKQIPYKNKFVELVLKDLSLKLFSATKYDFFAADIIADVHWYYYVLELNTAPGLTMDGNLNLYVDEINNIYLNQGEE